MTEGAAIRSAALDGGPAGRRAERALLLHCAGGSREPGQVGDWGYLLATATQHGLIPLLARHLAGTGEAPPAVAARLRAGAGLYLAENLRLVAVLRTLLRELEGAGIPALAFKGPALAQQAYGALGLRQISDLDVVVRPRDVARTEARLAALGFTPELRLSARGEAALLHWEHHRSFVDADGTTLLELHWRFAPVRYGIAIEVDEVMARRATVELAGMRVPVPALDDQLLLLCVHGARHLWERLEWVAGVAALLRGHTPDGPALLDAATRAGARRLLLTGLALAGALLDAPLPASLSEAVRADAQAGALARAAAARLFSGAPPTLEVEAKPALFLFNLRAKDRAADRLRFAARYLTTPTEDYWTGPRLPDALFPLYRLYRPFRLAGEYLVSRIRPR